MVTVMPRHGVYTVIISGKEVKKMAKALLVIDMLKGFSV